MAHQNIWVKCWNSETLLHCIPVTLNDFLKSHRMYKTWQQATFDLCDSNWQDLYTLKDKRNLEQVQKFACKMVSQYWDAGYEEIYWSWWVYLHLKTGGFISNYICLLYKITRGLCHVPTGIFTPRQIRHNFRMNSFQLLYQPFAQTQFCFVPDTISLWNSLHPER